MRNGSEAVLKSHDAAKCVKEFIRKDKSIFISLLRSNSLFLLLNIELVSSVSCVSLH